MVKVSIVIVTYNSSGTIKKCLESIFSDKEIVVVDNNSTDNTSEIVNKFGYVKLIRNQRNLGFGASNNIGVKHSSGQYLLFLNPDTRVEEGTIEKLEEYLDKNQAVAVVGPKLLKPDGSVQKEISNFPSLISEILVLTRAHRLSFFKQLVYPKFDYDQVQEAEHLMGAALMIRRAVFEEVGGFDENFFLWFEETDLLKRIKDKGYRIVYHPQSVVTHLVGQSTKQLSFWKRQSIWNKSLLHYFSKHKTWAHFIILLPFIILSYPLALITSLFKR